MNDEKDDLRKRTKRFALRVIKLYETLPREGATHVLAISCCAPAPQSAPTFEKHIVHGRMPNSYPKLVTQ